MSNVIGIGRERALRDPADIVALIADQLPEVEAVFRRNLASPLRIVSEIGDFVAESGGKRVRPTLHLLCARLCGHQGKDAVTLAAVLEFIHSATLIHDDIIDEAEIRRGRPSANARWGNDITVLFGDYLFAKAMEMALQVNRLDVMRKLADVTLRMTEGEMLQTRYIGRLDLTEEEYLDLVERKTAALFGCCCELAGMLADMDAPRLDALRSYGVSVGMAFQLVDDLLDFTGDSKTLGKPAALDLREGKATLAVIGQIQAGNEDVRRRAERIMDPSRIEDGDIAGLTALLHESGAIDRCREQAGRYAAQAEAQLAEFAPGQARDALQRLPEILLARHR